MRTFRILHIITLLLAVLLITERSGLAQGFKASPAKEKEQLAILTSDAPKSEKALACKRLAIDGSAAAVSELAKLLTDSQLSSWALIALEAIPGPEVDEALRKAAESLEGRLLIGVINSIGVRQDGKAVEQLTGRLQDENADVASAAAVALGRIGNESALKALREALASSPDAVRSAVAEGCVLCAERLLADGNSDEAVRVYDEIRSADVPKQRIVEATRGAILARKDKGIPLLMEQLASDDKALFQVGLATAREFPGSEVDKALAGELARANQDRAGLLIYAMADRPKTVVDSAIEQAAEKGPKNVRIAAIGALARVGDASSLPALLETAVDADPDLAAAAQATLAELPGEKVNAQIAAMLPQAKGKTYPVLIELIGKRRIAATPALLKALESSDKAIRSAALSALGETVDLKGLPVLITHAVSSKNADDAAGAQQALKTAAIRMPDREACAAELTAAMNKASSNETKVMLLDILGAVGGTKALAAMSAAGKSKDTELQDASTRLLGQWTTADAAPVLLDLAKTAPEEKFQTRALRGYIRIARQFVLPDDVRIEMCQKAWAAAEQPAEKRLVLEVLRRYPSEATLSQALGAMKVAEVKEDATAAVLSIAQSLAAKGVNVKDRLEKAGFERVKVEIVKAEYGSDSGKKDVTAVLRKQAGDLPLISLPDPTYNKSFGGDPAPGTEKKLKVQYKINGKAGEATFAEGALILLPTPK